MIFWGPFVAGQGLG